MRKLDQRGVAALEFCIIAVPLFFLMFAIFDLGRYAITRQSLQALANAGARASMICYAKGLIESPPPTCTGDLVPDPVKQAIAPFLYFGRFKPTLDAQLDTGTLTVRASSDFTMLMPIWGGALDAPSASTSVRF